MATNGRSGSRVVDWITVEVICRKPRDQDVYPTKTYISLDILGIQGYTRYARIRVVSLAAHYIPRYKTKLQILGRFSRLDKRYISRRDSYYR